MKNKIFKNILIILILFLSVSAVIMPKELNNLDEIWNYNFARNIADGLLPYRDFNMVQMPLLPITCGTILKLTLNELMVMRVLASILITSILYVTYKTFKLLKINQYICNILIIGIYLLMYNHFCIDYNYATLLIILITIYCELKNKEILDVNKKDFFLGILVGTSILFKQTTGLFFSVVFVFYKVLIVTNKEELIKALKIVCIRGNGVLLPVLGLVFYLIYNNIWYDFLDYTLYSLNTFTNRKPYLGLIRGDYGVLIAILSILVPITIVGLYITTVCKTIKTENQKKLFILFAYSVASFMVVYPIADDIHFLIGSFPTLITLGYIIWLMHKKIDDKNLVYWFKYFTKCTVLLMTIIIVFNSSLQLIRYFTNCEKYNELKHFKYIKPSISSIKNVGDFILDQNQNGKEVYILDATAAIYMIPIDKYNKDFDMFLKGNIGSKGEEGQIEKLEKKTNTIVLIMNKKYQSNWQNPEKVREYIVNNWTKVGQIENFDIYEINEGEKQ